MFSVSQACVPRWLQPEPSQGQRRAGCKDEDKQLAHPNPRPDPRVGCKLLLSRHIKCTDDLQDHKRSYGALFFFFLLCTQSNHSNITESFIPWKQDVTTGLHQNTKNKAKQNKRLLALIYSLYRRFLYCPPPRLPELSRLVRPCRLNLEEAETQPHSVHRTSTLKVKMDDGKETENQNQRDIHIYKYIYIYVWYYIYKYVGDLFCSVGHTIQFTNCNNAFTRYDGWASESSKYFVWNFW